MPNNHLCEIMHSNPCLRKPLGGIQPTIVNEKRAYTESISISPELM